MSRVAAPAPDLALAAVAAAVAARGATLGSPIHLADQTESTNDDAKRGAREGAPHGAVWVAEVQTAGRGRQGRAWVSARGENLLFSVLLRLGCAPSRVPPLSLVCGLAARDAIARALAHSDSDVVLKWPNDVLLRSTRDGLFRKVAGVLVESAAAGMKVEYVVVGIGINVHVRSFPPELSGIATSLAIEREARGLGGAPLDRGEILADVLANLGRDVEHVAHRGLGLVHARLARYDALAGREVEAVDDGVELRGTACGIDVDGRLLVRCEDGVVTRVSSGEMRIRPRAGHG